MTRKLLVSLVLLAPFALLGCERSPGGLPTVSMPIGSKTFTLEVAATEAAQEKGLMQRDALSSGHGMIFVFPQERVLGFWMKNTRIPLDIIFADAGGRVVHLDTMKPYDLNTTSSDAPSKYAIELNAGDVQNAGVRVGDTLFIPPAAKDPQPDTK